MNLRHLIWSVAFAFVARESLAEAPSPSSIELAPVEVVGSRAKNKRTGPAEFSGEYEAKEKETPVGRAIESGRGVSQSLISQSPGQEPQFVVRGLAPIQQRFFLEGVGLGDSSYGQSQLSWLAPESIEGVDTFADGVPLSFGSDGLGGAHSLRWRAFRECGNDLGTRVGSFGFFRLTGQHCFQKGEEPIAMRVVVSRSDENFLYREDHGLPLSPELHTLERRKGNGFSEIQFAPSLVLAEGEFKVISLNRWFQKNVPGPVSSPRQALLNENSHSAFLFYEPKPGRFRQVGHFKWDDTGVRALNRKFVSPLPSQSSSLSFGTMTSAHGTVWRDWEGQVSLGAATEELRTTDPRFGARVASRWETPVGAGLSVPVGRHLILSPAFQAHAYHYSPSSETITEWSPRLGVLVPIDKNVKLRASAGRFYRAPYLVERYGSAVGLAANPDLKAESALKAVLGADVIVPGPFPGVRRVRAGFDTGFTRADRLIAYEISSPSSQVARNVGTSEIFFQEASVQVELAQEITVGATAEWMATKNLSAGIDRGKHLPFRPGYRIRPTLGYEHGPWSIGYDAELVGAQFWDVANLKKSGSYWLHNARLVYRHRTAGRFSLEVLNLADMTDVPTQVGVFQTTDFSTGLQGFPAPGRRGYLAWAYDF